MKKKDLLRLYMRIANLIDLPVEKRGIIADIFTENTSETISADKLREFAIKFYEEDMRVFEFITQLLVTTNIKELDDYSIELYSGLAKRNNDIFNKSFGIDSNKIM